MNYHFDMSLLFPLLLSEHLVNGFLQAGCGFDLDLIYKKIYICMYIYTYTVEHRLSVVIRGAGARIIEKHR
jgi:hypothetical protein